MRRNGPLITLLTGLAVAAVLIMLSVTAATKESDAQKAANNAAQQGAGPAAGLTASAPAATTAAAPSAEAAKPLAGPVTYAGGVSGTGGTLAIAARDGKVIAYLCDGRRTEAWLQGTAVGGKLELLGKAGNLTGTYGNGIAAGTVTVNGRQWTFRLPVVAPPSGLYRASANVRNAKVVAGWIVVDGVQTGTFTSDGGEPGPVPTLDTTTNTATIDGTTVNAVPIDGGTQL